MVVGMKSKPNSLPFGALDTMVLVMAAKDTMMEES
jgi:hypothetical protein